MQSEKDERAMPNVDELERVIAPETTIPEEPRQGGFAERWANPKFRYAVIGLGGLLVAATILIFSYYHNRVSTDDAQVDGDIYPISAKISGNVAEVRVDNNQVVKAGQVLVRIDPRDYQVRVDQAKATLALAESQVQAAQFGVPLTRETTNSGFSSADAQLSMAQADYARSQLAHQQAAGPDLAYAEANVAKSQAEFDKASADLERMRALVSKQEISQQQFDAYLAAAKVSESNLRAEKEKLAAAERMLSITQAAEDAAKARVEQARAGVSEARANGKQVDIRTADLSSASAQVQQAKANLEAATLQLSYTTIIAPVDGVVTRKSVEPGQVIQPGQGLMMVVPLKGTYVTANFKETQLAKVRPGQKAEIEVDMYGKTFTGHVDSIAGATGARLSLLPPENATGNFVKVVQRIPVKIVLDPVSEDGAILRPGMNVDATIITK
jgi:membrane fusion protein, multidrug efflux system